MRAFLLFIFGVMASPALAGLEICNQTSGDASVSIGYKQGDVWVSEGWWVIEPGACATTVSGDLPNRYYYWHATNDDGEFRAQDYMFCTQPTVYTIEGDTDCEARGYDEDAFTQVDTGDARDYTVTLRAEDMPDGGGTTGGGTRQPDLITLLQGSWYSPDAEQLITTIAGNTLTDVFLGTTMGEGSIERVASCGGKSTGVLVQVVYVDVAEEPLCWEIVALDTDSFSFQALPTGPVVDMLRER